MSDERGISQAEAMRRRVSPEGRRLARLQRERARQATSRLVIRGLAATAVVIALAWLVASLAGPLGQRGEAATLLAVAIAWIAVAVASRGGAVPVPETASLPMLPSTTEAWLGEQRLLLPAPAVTLIDSIGARMNALAPHLSALDPATPAADDLRKLLGRELPGLVGQYHAVPSSMRAAEGSTGLTPDAQLLHGLTVVDRQLDELSRQVAAGAVDGLATHDRYLDTKYRGDGLG